jgi:hypothetical protein
MNVWESSRLRKCENTAKVHVHVSGVARMVQLFDDIIYIYAGTVSERQPQNLGLKNMSRS